MQFWLSVFLLLFTTSCFAGFAEKYQSYAADFVDDYQPYIISEVTAYSRAIAIKGIASDWQGRFYGGDRAVSYARFETGIQRNDWQIGVLNRCDYQIKFSRQTAEFVYLTNNKKPLEPGKQYKLRLEGLSSCSYGLRLGRSIEVLPSLKANLSVSYLRSSSFVDGRLVGVAVGTTGKDYDFQFDTDYLYSRDVLFGRDNSTPVGHGYTVDIKLDWQLTDQLSSQLSIIDIASRMVWNDAPHTLATAGSNNKTFDEEGYLVYEPVASGVESYKSLSHRLPRKLFFTSQYRWSETIDTLFEFQNFGIEQFSSIGAGWRYGNRHHFQGLYTTQVQALTLRYAWRRLRFELGSDHTEINLVRYFKLYLSYRQPF